MVNPTGAEVLQALAEIAPEELPEGVEPPTPGPVARAVHRLLSGG